MIKSLTDAHVADALPRIVASQDWVAALSEAVNLMHRRTMQYINDSQIYTDIGNASEEVLDALAVNWKIDWYDTGYAIEQKRRIIQTALTVQRLMGTVSAVKLQIDAILPETELEEWFDYGGDPGTFRLYLNVTETTPSNPAKIYSAKEIERRLITAKRWSAHLESTSYMIKRGVSIGSKVEIWAIRPPLCGTIYCGTYWMPSTLGRTERHAIATMPRAEAFNAQPDFAGTLPVPATVGYSACGAMACAARRVPISSARSFPVHCRGTRMKCKTRTLFTRERRGIPWTQKSSAGKSLLRMAFLLSRLSVVKAAVGRCHKKERGKQHGVFYRKLFECPPRRVAEKCRSVSVPDQQRHLAGR